MFESAHGQFSEYGFGPHNITQDEGDRNIFIPCPFGGPAAVSWKIGNNTYTETTLPSQYITVSSGLIIETVKLDMSGLAFQCFTPTGVGLYVQESSIGILTVLPSLTESEEKEGKSYLNIRLL